MFALKLAPLRTYACITRNPAWFPSTSASTLLANDLTWLSRGSSTNLGRTQVSSVLTGNPKRGPACVSLRSVDRPLDLMR